MKPLSRAARQRLSTLRRRRQYQGGYYAIIYYIIMIVLMILSYVLRPRPKSTTPSPSREADLPVADEGTAMRVKFGHRRQKQWVVLWYGQLRTEPVQQKVDGGKK